VAVTASLTVPRIVFHKADEASHERDVRERAVCERESNERERAVRERESSEREK
jgi:hypothetical protein